MLPPPALRLVAIIVFLCTSQAAHSATWQIGFAKSDITPSEPLRLSGYATRELSHEGVADPLNLRVMVMSPDDTAERLAQSVVLVSLDSIAVSSALSVEVAGWLERSYGIPRGQLAISSTHSHAAPQIAGALQNLYRTPSSDSQASATQRYTDFVVAEIESCIDTAFASRTPARLEIGESQAGFAINRRVIKDGTWSGFGEQNDGPVDRRVRVMVAVDPSDSILGGAFMYACHCTTLGPGFNQISGDWAGLSASRLESLNPKTVFLPIIGCGADANPNPRDSYEFAQQHAAELVDSVSQVLKNDSRTQITEFPVGRFGYAAIAPEQPSDDLLEQLATDELPNNRVWSATMQDIKRKMGRLPETYPMPIHTWQFGDLLTWVFLGGEVVVDYQFQIEKELPTTDTWVAAYTDDVFAYVASEAMRSEGGYEVDFSMIYYLQPGRWEVGTQDLIVRRTKEIFNNELTETGPKSPEEGLNCIRVPDGFRVELVAHEPLVQDPVNVAFGLDGSVWVVEMSDYPLGTAGGGRVKRLWDEDQDGVLDRADLFLQDLSYPTSVMPWDDGALVISAPDIFFAADRDGDGRAETREVLLTGIAENNPQHRASGFDVSLDGWLVLGVGSATREIKSLKNNTSYEVHGKDIAWNPTTGQVRLLSGDTQFVRTRDAFGNWFGNSNSRPMYQYVIEDRYAPGLSAEQDLLSPALAPPVYPRSITLNRFNDLFALDRFTSACSSIVVRAPGFLQTENDDGESAALVCEPVHNLVARMRIINNGSSFRAVREEQDADIDFFTSTDPWSRPVRVVNSPDGSIWVVDMVRKVIEHPEWIPTAWQERINIRGGEGQGRIYRVSPQSTSSETLKSLELIEQQVNALSSSVGAMRDQGLLGLMQAHRSNQGLDPGIIQRVRRAFKTDLNPAVRASALGALVAVDALLEEDLVKALDDADKRVVRYALEVSESRPFTNSLQTAVLGVSKRELGSQVDLQWILTTNRMLDRDSAPPAEAISGIQRIASESAGDRWLNEAIALLDHPGLASAALKALLDDSQTELESTIEHFAVTSATVRKLWKHAVREELQQLVGDRIQNLLQREELEFSPTDLLFLTSIAADQTLNLDNAAIEELKALAKARMLSATAPLAERLALIQLLATKSLGDENILEISTQLLENDHPTEIRSATISALGRLHSSAVGELLVEKWPSLNGPLRSQAGATLLTRATWVSTLLDAVETKRVDSATIDLATVQGLRSYTDRNLRSRSMAVFSQPTARSTVVALYLAETPAPHAGELGKKLFTEHCGSCHAEHNGKPAVGPPLENLKHWTMGQWIAAIMDPNQNVEPKYFQSTILTNDGQIYTGVIQSETSTELSIAQADGTQRSIPKIAIEQVTPTNLSLMPEGFESKVTPEQMAELLGYLRGQ